MDECQSCRELQEQLAAARRELAAYRERVAATVRVVATACEVVTEYPALAR